MLITYVSADDIITGTFPDGTKLPDGLEVDVVPNDTVVTTEVEVDDGDGQTIIEKEFLPYSVVIASLTPADLEEVEQLKGDNITPRYEFITLDAPIGTNGTTFVKALELNMDTDEEGVYEIKCSVQFSHDINTSDYEIQLQHNNTDEIFFHKDEMKESGGTGITVNDFDGGTFNSGTSTRRTMSWVEPMTLDAGSHSFDLDMRGEVSDNQMVIYKAHIIVERKR